LPASSRRAFHIALLVAIAFFIENLDSTVIVTAPPEMAQSFHTSPVDLNIGLTAYMLAVSVFLPISGRVVDRFGARRIFVSAIVIFTLSSVLCGLSVDQVSFTACRVLQGIGGAMMTPVGSTEKRDRIKMTAYIVWPGLVAPVLGPPVGGFITTSISGAGSSS
jgi:MFS family permease